MMVCLAKEGYTYNKEGYTYNSEGGINETGSEWP